MREALLQIESENKGSLRKILERVDKNAFERFHENDLKRTIRYLEVFFKMGRPLTELQNERDHNREFFLVILERIGASSCQNRESST